jgi:transcriptional regulator with XRE-family HTH domain
MINDDRSNLGKVIRQHRVTVPLTLQELSSESGVSPSHLGRIERGERFPSAAILRRIARPLGFQEDELFTLAGYLTPHLGVAGEDGNYQYGYLDPYVARMLAQEPLEIQRAALGVLTILRSIAKNLAAESAKTN